MDNSNHADDTKEEERSEGGGDGSLPSHRRRFLQGLGATGLAGVAAGCVGDGDPADDENGGDNGDDENDDENDGNGGSPNFEVTALDPEEVSAEPGDPIDIEATIENTGDGEGTQFVELRIGGDLVEWTEITLASGESEAVSFEGVDTTDLEGSEYTVSTDDDSASGTLAVATEFGILVNTSTPDWRHDSIPAAQQAFQELGEELAEDPAVSDVVVDIIDSEGEYAETEPTEFPSDASGLEKYDVLVFCSANGANDPESADPAVLNEEQDAALQEFVESGGGFVGVHSAMDAMPEGSFYTDEAIGVHFTSHPPYQEATVHVTDRTHPSTEHLPTEWVLSDEWYNYTEDPRDDAHVLCSVDQTTYEGQQMDFEENHQPMSWCREIADGRSWYTALGHDAALYEEDENFRQHLLGGIKWAAGLADGDANATAWENYTKTPLTTDTESPSVLDIAPDGRVFYVDRGNYTANGPGTEEVAVVDPDSGASWTALDLPVGGENVNGRNGLTGLVLDPDFEDNGWIYLTYAPANAEIDEPHNRLSRFTVDDEGTIDRDTEVEILRFPMQREEVAHTAGHLRWGPNGEQLYVAIGDDTAPFESSGYTPIDERDGREHFDAQRTAANTADLRGSILRIVPEDDGSYSIPEDNLFTEEGGYGEEIDDGLVRPEIFAMGVRNPYRIAVDAATGTLYWGDYGPDAGFWDAQRGPPGAVEYNRTDEAGFFGWPYVVGENVPYRDYDFDTEESGDLFDPENPVNDSPNNDGLTELPSAEGTMITSPFSWGNFLDYPDEWDEYVPYDSIDEVPFPQVTGGSAMQGPVYRHSDEYGSGALSEYYDGKVFIMDRGGWWIKYLTLNDDGEPVAAEPFLPDEEFRHPMDLQVGPDGALYLVEWGGGYDGPNDDSGIYRIERTDD